MSPYRYIFRQIARNFLGSYLLICILFAINFLAMHIEMVGNNRFCFTECMEHILRITLSNTYILAPLALLMSACVTYTILQMRFELVAFLTQGISRFKLLKPLIHVCALLFLFETAFFLFYDDENEHQIQIAQVVGSTKTTSRPIQILDLEHGEKVIFGTTSCKEAYLYTKEKQIFYTPIFHPHDPVFVAKKEWKNLSLEELKEPKILPISPLDILFHDPSKPFQILLIFCIPLLIEKMTFTFKRHFLPLMVLAKTSILYLGSHILVKSLCHIVSKLI